MQAIGDRTGRALDIQPRRDLPNVSRETWAEPFAGYDATGPASICAGHTSSCLTSSVRSLGPGTDPQCAAAAKILGDARRSLYLLLADGPDAPEA